MFTISRAVVVMAIVCGTSAAASITAEGQLTVAAQQTGRYEIKGSLFGGPTSRAWLRGPSPSDDFGYSQVLWEVVIPGIALPPGSILNAATLFWDRDDGIAEFKAESQNDCSPRVGRKTVFTCGEPNSVSGGQETFVNWVASGGQYIWLTDPAIDRYAETGTLDLVAMGLGRHIAAGDSVIFNGGHQLNMRNAGIGIRGNFFNSTSTWEITYAAAMTMNGTLVLDVTAPPLPPSSAETPEVSTIALAGMGLALLGFSRFQRFCRNWVAGLNRDHGGLC